ncbi:hypothetical protein [Paenibacillus humicola]|uniref:hypothetical protein n=1 Tax=Paenibacillus humicola TaxID=3110540 RepID=UPI00237A7692|nr:hypothetical protein [Paenibacillus humicola]
MKENKIDVLILIDEEENLTAFRLFKVYTDSKGRLMMSLIKDNVYYPFKVVQTDEGFTELFSDTNMRYRVSGISYKVPNQNKNKIDFRYVIADSFEQSLNLSQYIS